MLKSSNLSTSLLTAFSNFSLFLLLFRDFVDAQVNLARGVIVTTTTLPVTEGENFFGPASFHEDDYQFFYNNIKENVAKRIATYKANQ